MTRLALGLLLGTTGCSIAPYNPLDDPEPTPPSSYTVSGTATVQAVQDIAELTVELSVEGRTPKGAAAEVRALQTALDAAVDASAVVLDDRAVSGLRLSPVHVPIDS